MREGKGIDMAIQKGHLTALLLIFLALLFLILVSPSRGATAADMIADFRILTDEDTTQGSLVADTEILVFLDNAQDKIVRIGGYLKKSTDVIHSEDSNSYGLPLAFRRLDGIAVHATNEGFKWTKVFNNPFFMIDTTVYQYYIGWSHPDSARIYFKGAFWKGDTIRVSYIGDAADLDSLTAVCEVPTDLQTFIIEEAIANYERAKRNHQVQRQTQIQVRMDMGILKQVEP